MGEVCIILGSGDCTIAPDIEYAKRCWNGGNGF